MPLAFGPVFHFWGNTRTLRAAPDCQSFVSQAELSTLVVRFVVHAEIDSLRSRAAAEP